MAKKKKNVRKLREEKKEKQRLTRLKEHLVKQNDGLQLPNEACIQALECIDSGSVVLDRKQYAPEKKRTLERKRYRTDVEYRESKKIKCSERAAKKYHDDGEHRELKKRKCCQTAMRKYKFDPVYRCKKINTSKTAWAKEKLVMSDMDKMVTDFQSSCQQGPTHICTVCHRLLFRNQVVECMREKYHTNMLLANDCITGSFLHSCTDTCEEPCSMVALSRHIEWICYTCHDGLKRGRMPTEAQVNKLQLTDIPDELHGLNMLEKQLIALYIPFTKIVTLPKGGQKGMYGPVICVPSNIQKTSQILPRCPNAAQLVKVKLKRKLEYKGHHQYHTISPKRVDTALKYLIQSNPLYKNVQLDASSLTDEFELCSSQSPHADVIYDTQTNVTVEDVTQHPCVDNDSDTELTLPGCSFWTDEMCYERMMLMKESKNDESHSTKHRVTGTAAMATQVDHNMHKDLTATQQDDLKGKDTVKQSHSTDTENDTLYSMPSDSCLQPVDIAQDVLNFDDSIFCVAPAEGNKPVSVLKMNKLEAMAFPTQFPDAQNTVDEADRPRKLSPSRYFNARLFSADTRFCEDSQYIFFAQYVTELHQALSSISIALRQSKPVTKDGRKITSNMLKDSEETKKILQSDQGFRYLAPLRGSPAYWNKTMRDLFAMIRQLGIPTFFCTFSAAEFRWKEVVTVIAHQQGRVVDFDTLDWTEKCEILRSNPVTAMRMFDHRVQSLLRKVIISPADPIGEVVDFFYRTEFQLRGSPHIHCLFWVKDAPQLDRETDEEVCEFIDKFITCEAPDEDKDPILHEIVNSVQMHRKTHSHSCKKNKKICRFGFPRPPYRETSIVRPRPDDGGEDSEEKSEENSKDAKAKLQKVWDILNDKDSKICDTNTLLEKAELTHEDYVAAFREMTKSPSVVLKRRPQDCWVNNYNKHLLKAWNANLDIQYVLDPYSCVMYIVSYISKAEHEMSEILKEAQKDAQQTSQSTHEEMKKILSVYVDNREVSCQEAVTRICSLKLKNASREVVFIPTDENSTRISLPLKTIERKREDSEDIWMTSLVDRYKARPTSAEFENMCMATFASEYRIIYGQPSTSNIAHELQKGLGFVQKRSRSNPAVIRYARFSITRNPEKHYAAKLRLYLPYRIDAQLKPSKFETHEDFLKTGCIKLKDTTEVVRVCDIVCENQNTYEKDSDTIDEAINQYQTAGPLEDAWAQIAPESELQRLESEIEKEPLNVDENDDECQMPDLATGKKNNQHPTTLEHASHIPLSTIQPKFRSMNVQQSTAFYYVRKWCLLKATGNQPDAFCVHICGGAGTGKSHLISCIYAEATKILERVTDSPSQTTVLLTAPTGTAAYNIKGQTLHSVFKIPIHMKMPYQPLDENKLNTLRATLEKLQILVIDEISMVDKRLIVYINGRLKQIKGSKQKVFGGVSVLAVGDFFQLPPVRKQKPLCVYEDNVFDLWKDHFQKHELNEIMRQKDDGEFAQLLNRLRVKKQETKLSDGDLNVLSSVETTADQSEDSVLHVFGTNALVNEHNAHMLHSRCKDTVVVEARDFSKDPRSGRMVRKTNSFTGSNDDLPDILNIGIGARVILTRNIDVAGGLVNGAFGTVSAILNNSSGNTQSMRAICVQFDNPDTGSNIKNNFPGVPTGSVVIERFEETMRKRNATRQQFPIKLAFACTIHKVQGFTTTAATVSLKKIFEPGMAYVALSRTTSLRGLKILDFDQDKIYCSQQVLDSMESMPALDVSHVQPLLYDNQRERRFCIVHHNIERLPSHIGDIKCNPEMREADILCLSETWLTDTHKDDSLQLPGYVMHRRDRCNCYQALCPWIKSNNGGGIAIYVKEHVQTSYLQSLSHLKNFEFLALQVETPVQMIIVCIYRPPQHVMSHFLLVLEAMLNTLELENEKCILVGGDFNENLLSDNNTPIGNLFEEHKFIQLITPPTTSSGTLLDAVYIKNPSPLTAGLLQTYYGYHDPTYCVIQLDN